MVGKEIAVKKYVVRPSVEERNQLVAMISAGKRSARLLTKARILLKAMSRRLAKAGATAGSPRRWTPASPLSSGRVASSWMKGSTPR